MSDEFILTDEQAMNWRRGVIMCSLYLYYFEDTNIFLDECGEVVYDLFTVITPQDLFLFQSDYKFNCFPMVGQEEVTCYIVSIPPDDKDSGLYWLPGINPERFHVNLANLRK